MTQLQRLCERLGVKIDVTPGARLARDKQSDWQQNAHGYTCVLRYNRKKMTVDFWMGQEREPTEAEVINCLLSDSSARVLTFEEWCREYGYSSDSIAVKRSYRLCVRQGVKVERLLGEDYKLFKVAEH